MNIVFWLILGALLIEFLIGFFSTLLNLRALETVAPDDLSDVIAVYSGKTHSLALHSDFTITAWGKNDEGSLGLNSRDKRTSPQQVGSSTDWGGLAMGGRVNDYASSYFFEKAKG